MTDKRPVWLDESDLHVLRSAAQHLPGTLEQEALTRIADDWDAAPADPTDAAQEAVIATVALQWGKTAFVIEDTERVLAELREYADAVLRALGKPDA